MIIPKPKPIAPLQAKSSRSSVEEVGLFNGMGDDRVLVVRIGVDLEAEEVLIARCVAEGKVMRSVSRAWFSLGRIGEVWDVVTEGMVYDWALVVPDSGMEFLLGHIGGSDLFNWADIETMEVEARSGIMSRLSLGKPGVDEAQLKTKKNDVDLSSGKASKVFVPDPFEPEMMKSDLVGLPEFNSAFGSNNRRVFVAWTDGSYITKGSLRGVSVVTSTGHWVTDAASAGKAEYAEVYAMLLAVSHGIRTKARKVVIKSDSRAALSAVENWLNYRENKVTFRTNKMIKILNRLRDLVNNYPVEFEFTWVKGHSGNPGNESADRLARLTARRKGVGIEGVTDDEARGILVDTGLFNEIGQLAI